MTRTQDKCLFLQRPKIETPVVSNPNPILYSSRVDDLETSDPILPGVEPTPRTQVNPGLQFWGRDPFQMPHAYGVGQRPKNAQS